MATSAPEASPPKTGVVYSLRRWGENSFNPIIVSALMSAQHLRPFRPLPMLFPPVLLFGSFISLHEYKKDGGGILAASSGLYILLALRRKQKLYSKFSPRGIIRGATLGLCAINVVAGGLAYAFGDRKAEDERRILDD